MTPEQEKQERDGIRLAEFLQDSVILEAWERAERKAYDRFRSSNTPAERESAWAVARAIEELKLELLVTAENGAAAKKVREREELEEARRRPQRPR